MTDHDTHENHHGVRSREPQSIRDRRDVPDLLRSHQMPHGKEVDREELRLRLRLRLKPKIETKPERCSSLISARVTGA